MVKILMYGPEQIAAKVVMDLGPVDGGGDIFHQPIVAANTALGKSRTAVADPYMAAHVVLRVAAADAGHSLFKRPISV